MRRRAAALGHQSGEVRYALWAFRAGDSGAARGEAPARVISDPMGAEQLLCAATGELRVPPVSGALRGDLVAPVRAPRGTT